MQFILFLGFALVIFDFAGAGQSEGNYMTLGIQESDDAICVIKYL